MATDEIHVDYAQLTSVARSLRQASADLDSNSQKRGTQVPVHVAVYGHAGLAGAVDRVLSAFGDRQDAVARNARLVASAAESSLTTYEEADRRQAERLDALRNVMDHRPVAT